MLIQQYFIPNTAVARLQLLAGSNEYTQTITTLSNQSRLTVSRPFGLPFPSHSPHSCCLSN